MTFDLSFPLTTSEQLTVAQFLSLKQFSNLPCLFPTIKPVKCTVEKKLRFSVKEYVLFRSHLSNYLILLFHYSWVTLQLCKL